MSISELANFCSTRCGHTLITLRKRTSARQLRKSRPTPSRQRAAIRFHSPAPGVCRAETSWNSVPAEFSRRSAAGGCSRPARYTKDRLALRELSVPVYNNWLQTGGVPVAKLGSTGCAEIAVVSRAQTFTSLASFNGSDGRIGVLPV